MSTQRNGSLTGGDRMKRRTWVALTALAVAVAVGVLAGMVVRLGSRVKDSATTRAEATFSATQTGFVVVDPSTTAPSATLMPAKGPNVAAAPSNAPTTSVPAPSTASTPPSATDS